MLAWLPEYAIYPRPTAFPWWHHLWDRYTGKNREIIEKPGCPTVTGRVQCSPEELRAHAEQALIRRGVWRGRLPLATYTLARVIASEIGSGTPEEKVAVGEAYGLNAPRVKGKRDVNELLLYQPGPGHGAYGPIHDPQMGAPFQRFAATSRWPGIDDLLIADFVLKGRSQNFARGAYDQVGAEIEGDPRHPVGWVYRGILAKAHRRDYWVGPLPGVDHWRTFLFARRSAIAPDSREGRALIAAAQAALAQRPGRNPREVGCTDPTGCPGTWRAVVLPGRVTGRAVRDPVDWSGLPVAPAPAPIAPVAPRVTAASFAGIAALLLLASAIGLWTGLRASRPRPDL